MIITLYKVFHALCLCVILVYIWTLIGLPEVEPLRSLAQFEEYQADPEAFTKAQLEQQEKQKLKLAAKQKAAEEAAAAAQAAEAAKTKKSALPAKNVLTRMQCKFVRSSVVNCCDFLWLWGLF